MVKESDIKVEEFCWKEAARYILLTCQPGEIADEGLTEWMPKRRFPKGPRPGLQSRDVQSREIGSDSQWIFSDRTPP